MNVHVDDYRRTTAHVLRQTMMAARTRKHALRVITHQVELAKHDQYSSWMNVFGWNRFGIHKLLWSRDLVLAW